MPIFFKEIKTYSLRGLVIYLLFLALNAGSAFADETTLRDRADLSDYSKGMRAYMENSFEDARIHWLNGSKVDDARSMFNLGLLNEESKIADASLGKAEQWYRMAGKHGYAPADYHLANLILKDEQLAREYNDEVIALLQRSASGDFEPAKRAIAVGFPNAPAMSVSEVGDKPILSSFVSRNIIAQPVTRSNPNLGRVSIAETQPTNWTIQIAAFKDKDKIVEFMNQHELTVSATYFVDSSQGEVLYKLIYGSYASKQDAENAREKLSSKLKEHGPWLRTFASIQSILNSN